MTAEEDRPPREHIYAPEPRLACNHANYREGIHKGRCPDCSTPMKKFDA